MARLFSTNANANADDIDDTAAPEIVIENTEADLAMTTSYSAARSAIRKKLTGIWMKLATLSPADLVSELKAVHNYLAPMDQDSVDRSELLQLAAQLASPSLIKHKDRAVRVLTACALANILRLFAPEAPYSTEQLETMFVLFLHQLKGVADAQDPYYNYHYFLLESLSTVKSVVLVFDLPQAEVLQREIIQMALDLMHPSVLKGVRLYLLELVQTLLEEADQLSQELVTDCLLPALNSSNAAQTAMIADLLRACPQKLATPLAIHFNDQLSRLARSGESEATLAKVGRDTHDFAIQVASISVPAAESILKLLEEELKVEAVEVRQLAIHAIPKILLSANKPSPLLQPLRQSWLGRRNDKNAKCRITWIRGAIEMICREGDQELLEALKERLQDPDDRVRLNLLGDLKDSGVNAFVNSVVKLDSFSAFLEGVADRCLDKKEEVSQAAMALSVDFLFCLLKSNRPSSLLSPLLNRLLQLPFSESRIFSRAALGFLEAELFVRLAREFPAVQERAQKLVSLLGVADEKSQTAHRALLKQKSNFSKAWLALLKIARLPPPAINDVLRARSVQLGQFLSELMPGVAEVESQRALLALNTCEPTLLQLLLDVVEGRQDGLVLWTRIEAHLKASDRIPPGLKRVILAALPFSSQISLNSELIGALSAMDSAAQLLGDYLAEFPQLFANRTGELIEAVLRDPSNQAHLLSLAQYSGRKGNTSTTNTTTTTELESLLLEMIHPPIGSTKIASCKSVAYATQITLQLCQVPIGELIENLIIQLAGDEGQVACALAAFIGAIKCPSGQVASSVLSALLPHFETIFGVISGDRLCQAGREADERSSKRRLKQQSNEDLLAGWPAIDELSVEVKLSVLGAKFLSLFASALIKQHTSSSTSHTSLDTVSSIRSLTLGFLLHRLQSTTTSTLNIRLQYTLLKGLITCLPDASVADLVGPLMPLVLALQDTKHTLRLKLNTLLGRLLRGHRLSPAFLSLLYWSGAHEPLSTIKSTSKSLIVEIKNAGELAGEMGAVLCVIAAKHPDCQELGPLVEGYFNFFIECSMRQDNCAAVYESIGRLKLLRFPQEDSVQLYMVSELAQRVIRQYCAGHHWPLTSAQQQKSSNNVTSLLVPEVLVELPEPEQLRNIHTVYLKEAGAEAGEDKENAQLIEKLKGIPKTTKNSRIKLNRSK